MEHGTPIPTEANKNMMLGYPYTLRQQWKQIAKGRIEIKNRRDSAIEASVAYHRDHRHGSRFENLEYSKRKSTSKNLYSSFLSVDEQGNIIPKTPEATLVAAQAYLYTT
jgi:hypothetical protein